MIDDIVAGAANAVNTYLFFVNNENLYGIPEIIIIIHRLTDFITSPEFRRWFHKHYSKAKWIANTLVTMYYGIISGFAKLALDIENIMKMSEDVTVAYLKYAELKGKAEAYIASIKLGMKQSSLGHFTSPPHSY